MMEGSNFLLDMVVWINKEMFGLFLGVTET